MKFRPDLVPSAEGDNLEVIQLTDESIPSSHIYMEAQIFTPDSRRLVSTAPRIRMAPIPGTRNTGI